MISPIIDSSATAQVSEVSPLSSVISSCMIFPRIPGALSLSSNHPMCLQRICSKSISLKVLDRFSAQQPNASFQRYVDRKMPQQSTPNMIVQKSRSASKVSDQSISTNTIFERMNPNIGSWAEARMEATRPTKAIHRGVQYFMISRPLILRYPVKSSYSEIAYSNPVEISSFTFLAVSKRAEESATLDALLIEFEI